MAVAVQHASLERAFCAASSARTGDECLLRETPRTQIRCSLRRLPPLHANAQDSLRLDVSQQASWANLDALRASSSTPIEGARRSNRQRGCRASVGGADVADGRDQQWDQQKNDSLAAAAAAGPPRSVPVMKKGYGAYGGGATLERSKLDLSTSSTKVSPQIDLGGGGRGNNNKNVNGGGGGDDDNGDDDDYFGEDGDDDGDDDGGFFRATLMMELFDRASLEAILQEWFKTMADLPAGLRRAAEMGIISSAQLVRYTAVFARPTVARIVSRLTPSDISRAFIGRMIADPAFLYKVAAEQALTIGGAVHWEVRSRGERLKDEWDLAAVNVLTLAVCNMACIWALSPSRSYGSTATNAWQSTLQKLPNHAFDLSYPLRDFSRLQRLGAFVYKGAELSLFGSVAGAVAGAASNALVKLKKQPGSAEYRPSVKVPSTATSALAMGAFLGLSCNVRYQAVYGIDRYMARWFNYLAPVIFCTTALRALNQRIGEPSRQTWLGLDSEGLAQANAASRAYRRSSAQSSGSPTLSLPDFSSPTAFVRSIQDQVSALTKRRSSPRRSRSVSKDQGSSATTLPASEPVKSERKARKSKRKVTVAA
eukprot:TRINITY_DN38408_c0_g1_i1.p1 TRINITY_DN38408_c0_g1~~TRINITY_DN38408_c0_g1_i1.p1  ORF type:complete len:595 (-),score=121.99 TRINITY_DN38408_c0_g1_i1:783-2567(-)